MKNKLKVLYNPFIQIAGWKAFFIGGLIVLISVIVACYGNQYYIGVANIHFVPDANLGYAFVSQAIGLFLIVVLFYFSGLLFSKGVRFQDVLGTVVLSRYPYIIPAFFGYFVDYDKMTNSISSIISAQPTETLNDWLLFIVIALIMLVIFIWYIALLWNAFRVSTDLKGIKGIIIFIITLLFADILYYIFMYLINNLIIR